MTLADGKTDILLDYALLAALLTLVALILVQAYAPAAGGRTQLPVVVPAGGNA
jgi:hypothetical protein